VTCCWTKTDFSEAARTAVWNEARLFLDPLVELASLGPREFQRRKNILASKHDLAGSSCRYMLNKTCEEVEVTLRESFAATDKELLYGYLTGSTSELDESGHNLTTLVSKFSQEHSGHLVDTHPQFVSLYAAQLASEHYGPDLFKRLEEEIYDGEFVHTISLFEPWFFSWLLHCDVPITVINRLNLDREQLPCGEVTAFDPLQPEKYENDVWLRPGLKKRAGIDAVHYSASNKRIQVVLMCLMEKQGLDAQHVRDLVVAMRQKGNVVETVEICFLLAASNFKYFTICQIYNQGCLQNLKVNLPAVTSETVKVLYTECFR
jgi:hypothetical protein